MADLEFLWGDLAARLPDSSEGHLVLRGSDLPLTDLEITAPHLKVVGRSLGHSYGDSAYYDVVDFFADKPTYRRLGLLFLASVFHPNSEICLYPRHPESTITKIKIGCYTPDSANPHLSGLASTPVAYGYDASPVRHRYPLFHDTLRVEQGGKCHTPATSSLPYFHLTNESGGCGRLDQLASRTVVEASGDPEMHVTLASLLLDIGLTETELTEFCLEGPSGNWSVAIGSAEARFWVGYDYH